MKSWRIIIDTQNIERNVKSDEGSFEILDLAKKLSLSEPIIEDDIHEWINTDEQREISNEIIVNNENESSDDSDDDSANDNLPYR